MRMEVRASLIHPDNVLAISPSCHPRVTLKAPPGQGELASCRSLLRALVGFDDPLLHQCIQNIFSLLWFICDDHALCI